MFKLLTFGHDEFPFIIKVTINIICPVVDMYCSGGRTGSQCRQACFVMGPPLVSSCFGYLSFWMCHFK